MIFMILADEDFDLPSDLTILSMAMGQFPLGPILIIRSKPAIRKTC
jgi:hypothetical protein